LRTAEQFSDYGTGQVSPGLQVGGAGSGPPLVELEVENCAFEFDTVVFEPTPSPMSIKARRKLSIRDNLQSKYLQTPPRTLQMSFPANRQ
jgi:hypothetical protein